MKLEGSFDTFPLRELVDMIVYSSVTGALNIAAPDEVGHLYFRESVLYHAACGASTGVDALAELLELRGAGFSFVSEVVCDVESLYGTVSTHMQAAEQLSARWRQIRAYVPNLDLVPHVIGPREATLRRASPAHVEALQAIDGRASLRELAARLGWAPIDTAEAITQLSLDGLVELRSQRHTPANQGPPAAAAPRGHGLFDRILAHAPARPAEVEAQHAAESPLRTPADELILRVLRS